jgi:acetyl esterase/lipase
MNDSTSRPRGTRSLIAPELLPALDILPSFDFNAEVLRTVRAGTLGQGLNQAPLSDAQRAVRREERFVPGPPSAPDVRVLLYYPAADVATAAAVLPPVYLHIHGGGYILGRPETYDGANRRLVAQLGCAVVSADYRLAPETRFPGAIEDCYAVLTWLTANAAALHIDARHIAIGGESAGGGHAAALAILARARREIDICLQVLDSPMLDDRTGSDADPHPYCGEFVWSGASNQFGWRSLLGAEPGSAANAHAVPARVADLSGLPPTFILVGALDLFLEESLTYARRLARAGVAIELHVIPGAFHGFEVAGSEAPQVQTSIRLQHAALARAFRSG